MLLIVGNLLSETRGGHGAQANGLLEQLGWVDSNAASVFCLFSTFDVVHTVCSAASMLATDVISAHLVISTVAVELKVLKGWTYEMTIDASGRCWHYEFFQWSVLGQVSS